jgi:hypothetical protein
MTNNASISPVIWRGVLWLRDWYGF